MYKKKRKNFNSSNKIQDDKLKPLRPTLRLKKRFLKVYIKSEHKFDFKQLSDELLKKLTFYIGVIDMGKGGVWLLRDKFDENEQTFVLKVSTKFKDKLLASLSLINELNKKEVNLEVKRVSGTLKGLQKD